MTVPVRDRSVTFEDVHEAARASTACTAMYRPAQLKDSNMISAVFSRFSGGFRGYNPEMSGFIMSNTASRQYAQSPYRFGEKEVVVLGLHAQIFED